VLLTFVFFLPGIFMILSCTCVGINPTDLPIGVLNQEAECRGVTLNNSCEADSLSCYFINSLNRTDAVHLLDYQDADAMRADLSLAKLRGELVIPKQFTNSFLQRLLSKDQYDEWLYYYGVEEAFEGDAVQQMKISLDTSNPGVALVLREAIFNSLDAFFDKINIECGGELEGDLDLMVVAETEPGLGRMSTSFQEWVVPALLALSFFFQAMCLTSESFIAERAEGLLERSWLVGVLSLEIVVSYVLSQFLIIVVQVIIALVVVFFLFKIPCDGPVLLFVLLCLLQGMVGMSYGFFLSTICDTTADAMKMAISSFFPVLMVCGVIWPLEGMPNQWLQKIAWFLPQTASMQGMRDISLRGWGLQSEAVYQGIIIASAWSSLFLCLSWLLVRRKL